MATPRDFGLRQGPLLILIVSVIITLVSCNGREIQSSWATEGVAVDGKVEDWNELPATYFEDENVVIGITNDDENLYLQFRTREKKYAQLMKRTGLTIYLDACGGKSKDFFVRLVGGPEIEISQEMRPRKGQWKKPGFDGAVSPPPRFTCFIQDVIIEKEIPFTGEQGPAAASDTSLGFYCWEASVPLCPRAVRYYGLDMQPGQKLGLGLVWGEMDGMRQPERMSPNDMPNGGMGGRGGGMGGRGGGGKAGRDGGGMGGRGGGGGRQLPEKQEIWLKTTLVTEP